MRYRVGVEDIELGHWVAWALDLPGCFSSAPTQQAALDGAPLAIAAFEAWRRDRGRPLPDDAVEIQVEEVFHSYYSSDDYLVNAFFADDQRALTAADAEEAHWLLAGTRQDLLDALKRAPAGSREPTAQTEQGDSCLEILRHLAVAERWYFGRLGLEQAPLPDDPRQALEVTRAHSVRFLPRLIGDSEIREWSGERWSARKVVRRTLWHERDHTRQIAALLGG